LSGSYNASCSLPPCLELAPRSEVALFPAEKMPLFHTITLQTNDARLPNASFCDKVEFCISCHQLESSSNSVDTSDIDVLPSSVSGGTVNYDPDYLSIARLITNSPNDTNSVSLVFSKSQPYGRDNEVAGEPESYRFTGKPYISSTGLYYSFHRWYDPETGRFISQDPILGSLSYPQTLNRYTYTVNNLGGRREDCEGFDQSSKHARLEVRTRMVWEINGLCGENCGLPWTPKSF